MMIKCSLILLFILISLLILPSSSENISVCIAEDIKEIEPVISTEINDINKVTDKEISETDIELYNDKSTNTLIYKDTTEKNNYYAIISQIPRINPDRTIIGTKWLSIGDQYRSFNNTYDALVSNNGQTIISFPYHDIKDISYKPDVYLDQIKVDIVNPVVSPQLDYFDNENYTFNCLIWDYGFCKRLLRQIEGQLQGKWIFTETPNADVTIRYNHVGKTKLALGEFAVDSDTEHITANAIESLGTKHGWPVIINDTLTVYPDADAETDTVDGYVYYVQDNQTWATIHDSVGNQARPSATSGYYHAVELNNNADKYNWLARSIYLFDTDALPDDCTISSATFSVRSGNKSNTANLSPEVNVYASNPSSNTNLVGADYNTLSTTPLCDTNITYTNWDDSGWNDFVLNAAGLALISKTGITKLGGMDHVYDALDSAPPNAGGGGVTRMDAYFAEQGAGYVPKLVIQYSTGGTPMVTTGTPTAIADTSVTGNGVITDINGGTPSSRGFCYKLSGTPTYSDDKVSEAWSSGTGPYSVNITGLTSNTTYSVRAFAITNVGTGYGEVVIFKTLETTGGTTAMDTTFLTLGLLAVGLFITGEIARRQILVITSGLFWVFLGVYGFTESEALWDLYFAIGWGCFGMLFISAIGAIMMNEAPTEEDLIDEAEDMESEKETYGSEKERMRGQSNFKKSTRQAIKFRKKRVKRLGRS